MTSRKRSAGITLVELCIVVLLFSTIATISYQAMLPVVTSYEIRHWQERLRSSLAVARYNAVLRGVPTVICASENGTACGTSGWSNGWIIFEDPAGFRHCTVSGARCLEHEGKVLLQEKARGSSVRIVANHNVSRRVLFNTQGMSYGYPGRFTFCVPSDSSHSKGLVLSQAGRVRSAAQEEFLACP